MLDERVSEAYSFVLLIDSISYTLFKSNTMQRFSDSHTRCDDAARIARFLIDERFSAELGHLSQARLLFLLSQREVQLRGFPAWAYICRPRVQGAMSAILEDLLAQFAGFDGEDPDFVIRIDAAAWDDLAHTNPAKEFWRALHTAVPDQVDWTIGRERLIFHELLHTYQRLDAEGNPRVSQEDGRPVLALRPHDHEFFSAELEHYGPTVCHAEDAAIAIADGAAVERRRKLRLA